MASIDENRKLALKQLDDFNRGDMAACAASFAEDSLNHGRRVGRQGIQLVQSDIVATFPDFHQEVETTVAEGDWVVCLVKASGTHSGTNTFPHHSIPPGTPPTGRRFEAQIIHMFKIVDGQIREHRAGRDDVAILAQLGLA